MSINKQNEVTMGYIVSPSFIYPDFRTAISKGAEQIIQSNSFGHLEKKLNSAKQNPRYNDLEINCLILAYLQRPILHLFRGLDLGHAVFYDKKNDLSFLEFYSLDKSIWFPKISLKTTLSNIESVLSLSLKNQFIFGGTSSGYLLISEVSANSFYEMYSFFIDF